jgi:hypothetical protein
MGGVARDGAAGGCAAELIGLAALHAAAKAVRHPMSCELHGSWSLINHQTHTYGDGQWPGRF